MTHDPAAGHARQTATTLAVRLRHINQTTLAVAIAIIVLVIIASSFTLGLLGLANTSRLQARMLAESAAAALVFQDSKAAQELMASLRNLPQIDSATLYLPDGQIFASYQGEAAAAHAAPLPVPIPAPRLEFTAQDQWIDLRHIKVTQPVVFERQPQGSVHLDVDLKTLYQQTAWQALAMLVAASLALLASRVLLNRLNVSVLAPMQALERLTQRVSSEGDYTLRATAGSIAELNALSDGFNNMLEQIQQRDKSLADHRDHLEDKVAQRTAELLHAKDAAEAASRAKSEFLATMSHEIRTPLNGIVAMAHVMAMAPLPPREKEAAKLICSSGQTLERLLSDILDLAKVEAGQLEIQLSSFHLGSLVQNATSLARVLAEEKGLRLATTIDDTADCIVTGDEVRITQILTNLISNAVKFTSHGLVSISLTKTPENRFRFCVEDTGLGFGEGEKSRIFDRFQQADGTITRRFGGSGLGLSISRHLVDMMGGTLDCESTPGAGSLFWFELDLPADEAAALAEEPARTRPIMAKRLLVVDDHPTNLTVVQIILDGAGISVTTAADGQAALSAWEAASFDLILMDMQMPVMDGLTAVREIRAVEGRTGRRTTPIIMLTANASADHILASSEAGADGHLTKPISPASLFSSIEAALANHEVFLQNSNSEAASGRDESEESPRATRI